MQFLLFSLLFVVVSCDDVKQACLIARTDSIEEKEFIRKRVKPVGKEYKCEVDIIDGLTYPGYEVYKALHEYLKAKGVEVCPFVLSKQEDCS